MNSIIPFNYESIHGQYSIPDIQNHKLHINAVTAIINAWNEIAVIDDYGRVWVNSEKIHIVLRTTKENASYMIAGLGDDQKYRTGKNLFIRGESIYYLLDYGIQNARSILRENYIKHSQLLYIAIRDCSRARELRAEHYEYISKIVKSLKQKRINQRSIRHDELTGELLHGASAEFSHIRSVSVFPHLAGFVENGLIVNKTTHNVITSMNINDEEQLIELCNNYGWKTNWYSEYKNYIGNDIS
jgi:hypothetical protein